MVWYQYAFLQKEMTHTNRVIKENLKVKPFTKVWAEFRKTNMGYRKTNMGYCNPPRASNIRNSKA